MHAMWLLGRIVDVFSETRTQYSDLMVLSTINGNVGNDKAHYKDTKYSKQQVEVGIKIWR